MVVFWLHCHCWSMLPENFIKLGETVMLMLESLWQDGEPLGLGETCVVSLQYFLPSARGHLRGAWNLLKTWRRLEPPSRTPPWPRKLCVAIVGVLVRMNLLNYAFAIMVGYDCCLRTVEMCHLRSSHFICMKDNVIARLGVCKTGHKDNRLDSSTVECPKLKELILRWRGRKGSGDL